MKNFHENKNSIYRSTYASYETMLIKKIIDKKIYKFGMSQYCRFCGAECESESEISATSGLWGNWGQQYQKMQINSTKTVQKKKKKFS